jgi:hypothetical protein
MPATQIRLEGRKLMIRNIWKPALALGAVLAVSGVASAGDRDTMLLSGTKDAATMTLGGKGTVEQAATSDLEQTRGYHYGGYRGWGGGYGYRGYYGGYRGGYYGGYRGGYYTGYRGGYYGYRGGYYGGYYPRTFISLGFGRPYYGGYYGGLGGYGGYYGGYYPSAYSYPIYSGYYGSSYYGCSSGVYLGIAGGAGTAAPVVNLGDSFASPPPVTQPMAQPAAPEGTFPYDGGPSNPVPLPNADPKPPTVSDLPISGKKPGIAPATTPYKYKAYGEK